MLAAVGLNPRTAWRFDLYGGTVLLAAAGTPTARWPDEVVLVPRGRRPRRYPRPATSQACTATRTPTPRHSTTGWPPSDPRESTVLGYGAASRTVALLRKADVDRTLLPAVIDASPAKQGRRMPGTDIPVVAPAQLAEGRPRRRPALRPGPADRGPAMPTPTSRPLAAGGSTSKHWAHEACSSTRSLAGIVAGGADASDRKAEFIRYLRVGNRRIGHEHFE